MTVWSLEETSSFLKTTPKAIRNKVMRRQIPFRKLAGRVVFIEDEILTWIEKAPGFTLANYLEKVKR